MTGRGDPESSVWCRVDGSRPKSGVAHRIVHITRRPMQTLSSRAEEIGASEHLTLSLMQLPSPFWSLRLTPPVLDQLPGHHHATSTCFRSGIAAPCDATRQSAERGGTAGDSRSNRNGPRVWIGRIRSPTGVRIRRPLRPQKRGRKPRPKILVKPESPALPAGW